jgi:outer membrane protein, adhesin transport system
MRFFSKQVPWTLVYAVSMGCCALQTLAQTVTSLTQTQTAKYAAFSNATSRLRLQYLLEATAATYPSLMASRAEARANEQDLEATQRQRWPTFSSSVESLTGNARSFPSRSLQVEQTVWDAGRVSARISEAQANVDQGYIKTILQRQELFLQVVAGWQNLMLATARAQVAAQTIKRLREFQAQMQRRVDAEASPRIDLELANARLLQTEVELETAQSNLQVALTRLEQLSGEQNLATFLPDLPTMPSLQETQGLAQKMSQIDWHRVAAEHPSVMRAQYEAQQAKSRLKVKQSEGWPQIYVRAFQPLGTLPTSSDTGMTTFIGLRYTPGAGLSNIIEAQALETRISSAELTVMTAHRDIQQTFLSDQEEWTNTRKRIAALEKSVQGSDLVLASYQRQFQAGRKTWQDLLNAVRELAQNQYALVDAQAAMMGAMYRLQIRMGQEPQY